jgi:hypothetical protein
MKKKKVKSYLKAKESFYKNYYRQLLSLIKEVEDKELKKQIALRIRELENKLRKKETKICVKCFSLDLKYRVNKNYKISVCKNCGYQLFIKLR